MTTDNKLPRLIGDGKGGGGAPPPYNAPVTLFSKQSLYILMAISEGEIKSINNIFFNDTNIENYTASFAFTRGEVDQGIISGFADIPSIKSVGQEIVKANTLGVTVELDASADYADVTIQLDSLYEIRSNGDNVEAAVNFDIYISDVSTGNAGFVYFAPISIYGKTNTPYTHDTRVYKPNTAGGWQIRVLRTSADYTNMYASRSTLAIVTEYNKSATTNYPGTALLAIRLEDASELGNQQPTIGLEATGMKLMLPTSSYYDPAAKVYRNAANTAWVAGTDPTVAVWNGTFHTVAAIPTYQYTNNLSWIIYNVISDWLFMVIDGIRYPKALDIPKDYIAHFTFNEFAKYCDELLTHVDGSQTIIEPRYTLNAQFIERVDAWTTINALLALGNARLIETGGLVSITWDRRYTDAEIGSSPLFTNQNIDGGMFEYTSSDITENYTAVNITMQDIDNKNKTKTVNVQSKELIDFINATESPSPAWTDTHFTDIFQYNTVDIIMQGITSTAAAIRKGRGLLFDSLFNGQYVHFKVMLEGAILHVGQLIRVHDSGIYNTINTGRIVDYSQSDTLLIINLDRSITISGVTYLILYLANGTPFNFLLNETTGSHTSVTVTIAAPVALIDQSIFCQKTDKTSLYKVVVINKNEDFFEITGMPYDARKFDFIEETVTLPVPNPYSPPAIVIGVNPPVSNVTVADITPPNSSFSFKVYQLQWEHIPIVGVSTYYTINWTSSDGSSGTYKSATTSYTFKDYGTFRGLRYTFSIVASSSYNKDSIPVVYYFQDIRWDDEVSQWDTTGLQWH